MKDIKGNFVNCDARAITPRGRKRRTRTATGKERGARGCRLIYAVARDGKNYERNATSRRATPNPICPHPASASGIRKQNYIRRHRRLKRPVAPASSRQTRRNYILAGTLSILISLLYLRFNTNIASRVVPGIFLPD